MNVLITGGTGFIGSALINRMLNVGSLVPYNVRSLDRNPIKIQDVNSFMGAIDDFSNYRSALEQVNVVIHTAAIAHDKLSNSQDSLSQYQTVNNRGTLNLARQSAAAGVKRFIFISSIGVNGGHENDVFVKNGDAPNPWNDFTQSKYDAEQGLWAIQAETGLEIVIIRPPLVYGPSAPGNFGKLISAVNNEKWLPLGCIYNQRSFVALDNLLDLIITCVNHSNAVNQIFLVSDDQDISTTELLRKMASAFGKKSRLIPIPMGWIHKIASVLGKRAVAQRLCSSLVVDMSHTKQTLNWKPPVTMEFQLAKIAASLSQLTPDN